MQDWLGSVFAGEDVPDYEITHSTVEQLWQLASESKARESQVETVVEDLQQKALEYTAESEGKLVCFQYFIPAPVIILALHISLHIMLFLGDVQYFKVCNVQFSL